MEPMREGVGGDPKFPDVGDRGPMGTGITLHSL